MKRPLDPLARLDEVMARNVMIRKLFLEQREERG